MRPFLVTSILVFFLIATNAKAGPCQYFKKNAKALYKLYCGNGESGGSARPAGASSTFSSSFNISSAALPTDPTDYGIETIVSVLRSPYADAGSTWSPNFAIIKGFNKFGAGVSTSAANTFYSNDILQRTFGDPELRDLSPPETATGKFTNLNLGTSFALWSPEKGPQFSLGLSARYNKVTHRWGGGPALLMSGSRLSLGAGISREKISHEFPALTFYSGIASVRLWILELEYNYLMDSSHVGLSPVHIVTATATVNRLILTAAIRRLNYRYAGKVNQAHYAIQALVTDHLSLGALYNYIPGATSLGVQIYF